MRQHKTYQQSIQDIDKLKSSRDVSQYERDWKDPGGGRLPKRSSTKRRGRSRS